MRKIESSKIWLEYFVSMEGHPTIWYFITWCSRQASEGQLTWLVLLSLSLLTQDILFRSVFHITGLGIRV